MNFIDHQNLFMRHLRAPDEVASPDGIEERRMKVYRDLFFNNIQGFLNTAFPVLHSVLAAEEWTSLARRFFADHDCRSPYFVDISKEFVEYLSEPEVASRLTYPFIPELAHYEWLELDISVRHSEALPDSQTLTDESCLTLFSGAELVSYAWPVHQISQEFVPHQPNEEPIYFIVHRDKHDEVCFSQVNAVTAHLVNTVAQSEINSLKELCLEMVKALPQLPEADVFAATEQIISDLVEQQIILSTQS